MVNFDIKERQPREPNAAVKKEAIGTPKIENQDIEQNFQDKLHHLGSTVKEKSGTNTVGRMPEAGLFRDDYEFHGYDNQFQAESSARRFVEDNNRGVQDNDAMMQDHYNIDPDFDFLDERVLKIEDVEDQIHDLMNITPEKLTKFEAEFKGETGTKRKVEPKVQFDQIDDDLEARIEKVVEGYEKFGEMKMTVDKILSKIVGDYDQRKSLEPLACEDKDVRNILDIIEGNVHNAESHVISRGPHSADEYVVQFAG